MSDRIEVPVFPQDPISGFDPIKVSVRPSVLPGPIGDRVAVYDYNRDTDSVYEGARPRSRGGFPEYDVDDFRFHQLNAYAIVARGVELVELELGRDLTWGFDSSRLIVLPHAGYLDNAFYSEETHSLQLYSFTTGDDAIYHTALSHDIVTHEMGHAILDAVHDRYTEGTHPETAALHEGIGDLTALFASLVHEPVRKKVKGRLDRKNLVSEIAETFAGPHGPIRSLHGGPRRDWEDVVEPHRLSLRLTRAVYDALCATTAALRQSGRTADAALVLARTALQRMVVRALDYMPPADGTLAEFALSMLAADRLANPDDGLGIRRITGAELKRHGLLDAADLGKVESRRPVRWDVPRSWPRPSRREAYLLLDGNRSRLALSRFPQFRDFVVRDVHVTRSPRTGEDQQVIILYEYPVDVELPHGGRTAWLTMWGGGTLVFDVEGRLVHHARKPVTKRRIDTVKRLVGSAATRSLVMHADAGLDDRLRAGLGGHPWVLAPGRDGNVQLRANPAARCGRGAGAGR